MKAALLQLTSSDQPDENLASMLGLVDRAVADGAGFVLTPEVSNCVSLSRSHQQAALSLEADDPTLQGLREAADRHGIWLSIGSLALKTADEDGRFANRSFVISPKGEIAARYDKIHMFDVQLSKDEKYEESKGYRPGDTAVTCNTPFGTLGLSICYDLRFPTLYRRLAQAGADILLVPAAFAPGTGAAHWHTLLRARAIETGSFVLAAAQTGTHPASGGRQRETFGHSLAVGPWGDILADAGNDTGMICVDLDLALCRDARRRLPSLRHDREFGGPA